MEEDRPVIAVIGGTGALGYALARRWLKAGFDVTLGSRDAAKAQAAADLLGKGLGVTVGWAANRDAAEAGDVLVLTVPFASQAGILASIKDASAGKLVIDATVPLVPPRV